MCDDIISITMTKKIKDNLTILLKDVMLVKKGSKDRPSYYINVPKEWIKSKAINPEKPLMVIIEQRN